MRAAIVPSETVPFSERRSVVLAVFLVPLVLAILLFTIDFGAVFLLCLAAVVPAAVVTMFAARWLAPRGARSWASSLLALAWGAGAAVLLATAVGAWSSEQAVYVDDRGILREAIPTLWVSTPVVEEVGKGLGVLLVLLLARRLGLRGVLFGAMVGALVGVGFAAVEDASAIAADIAANDLGSGVATWIVRTLTFPTHAALTIWTGAALGLALDARRAWSRPLLALAGLLVAIGAHGAINYGNVAGATDQASFFASLGTAFGWIVVSTVLAVTLRLVLTRRRA
ncbi:PrsW family glutamic-type intramembrane protease [Zhihengliuella sp. ISTPL4]|uniref:PrsW family glutamic-type intramembrane protease n=1 Tax=Zhihengliuella sp. ISTPL4 TaxID=2058657 RepID=UPI000C7994A6|nr:PrsW family glutamic-type intramembrane protease [Zhihengliuella sp. ISTPL4]